MRFFASPVTTAALAAVCLLGSLTGTADAQTKSCVRNCLKPYATASAAVKRQVKPKCRAACNAVKAERHVCLNEASTLFKDASKTCAQSLKRIKRGQPPLTVSIPIGDSRDGNVTSQVLTYNYEPGCKQFIRSLWTDVKVGYVHVYKPRGSRCIDSTTARLTFSLTTHSRSPAMKSFAPAASTGTRPRRDASSTPTTARRRRPSPPARPSRPSSAAVRLSIDADFPSSLMPNP